MIYNDKGQVIEEKDSLKIGEDDILQMEISIQLSDINVILLTIKKLTLKK